MSELFWVVRMCFVVWVAWKAVLMLDVGNPLMGIFFAIVLMFAGPFALDMLAESMAQQGDEYGVWEVFGAVRFGVPMAFALIGAFLWSCVEAATGR